MIIIIRCVDVSMVKPVYSGHLGTNVKCPDYQGVLIFQVSLHVKPPPLAVSSSPAAIMSEWHRMSAVKALAIQAVVKAVDHMARVVQKT